MEAKLGGNRRRDDCEFVEVWSLLRGKAGLCFHLRKCVFLCSPKGLGRTRDFWRERILQTTLLESSRCVEKNEQNEKKKKNPARFQKLRRAELLRVCGQMKKGVSCHTGSTPTPTPLSPSSICL